MGVVKSDCPFRAPSTVVVSSVMRVANQPELVHIYIRSVVVCWVRGISNLQWSGLTHRAGHRGMMNGREPPDKIFRKTSMRVG